MLPDLKIEDARIVDWIVEAWDFFAALLFFGSIIVAIAGGVKAWPFKKVWLINAIGMVGAYLIWDVVLVGARPGYGDQPGVIAALFLSPVMAALCMLIGAIIHRCARLFRGRKEPGPPRLSIREIMAELLPRLPVLALLGLTFFFVVGRHYGAGAICMLIGGILYGCLRLHRRSKVPSGPTPPVPQ